jgi:NAD(P)-dependent dehydrogenase (short-subunit alcohol dehydrogenase family)
MAAGLSDRGARVVIADIDEEALGEAEAQLRASGAEVLAVPTDVTKSDSVAALADRAFERFGRVDVVCLNAGVSVRGRSWELTVEDWRWVYDVNVFGVVHGVRSFVPRLLEQGAGHVLITASNSSVTTLPSVAPYISSKHAVLSLAETLRQDLLAAGSPVGVSVVLPGAIRSRMADAFRRRPAEYGAYRVDPEVVDRSKAYLAQHGMDPRVMADAILQQALDDHMFCIFTDSGDTAMLEARTEALRAGRLASVDMPVNKEVK